MIITAEELGLKPCPFCGEYPTISHFSQTSDGKIDLILECCMQFIVNGEEPTVLERWNGEREVIGGEQTAIKIWNRRVNEQTTGEEEI